MLMSIKSSIRKRLGISLVILSIAPLLLFGGILLWQNYAIQQQEAKELQNKLTMLAAQKISSYIHEKESFLFSMVRINNDLIEMDNDRQYRALSKILFSSGDKQHREMLNFLALLDGKGKVLTSVSRESFFSGLNHIDLSKADEFIVPAKSGNVYYGPVFFNERTGEPLMKMSLPILDLRNMNVRGVLVVGISLKFMLDVLEEIKVGKTGIAYVLDRNGRVIAHPNPSVVLRGSYFKAPEHGVISTGLQGTKSLIDIDTLQLGSQKIIIVTELPVSEALRHTVRSLITISVFLVLTLFGAFLLRFILIRQIVQPIESLSCVALAISKGDFSRNVQISRSDELGDLANAFNIMTSNLVKTIHFLEEQMVEITMGKERITEQNELLNNILNSLTHPFYVINVDNYTIKMANSVAGFGNLTDTSTCYSLTHKRDTPCEGDEHPCMIEEIKKTGKPVDLDHVHYDDKGIARYIEVHGYPIFDNDGNVFQIIEYTIDITAKKKLEEQLLQSQKMEAVGQLAGGIAHDFNNILSVILIYSEMILNELPEDHPGYNKCINIYNAGEKAAALTRQLLAFSRKQILEMKVVNLNSIAENMTKFIHRIIGDDIQLELSAMPDLRNVEADPGQIEQVLMNLAVNARDAMPRGGRLTIETDNVELDEEYAKSHEGIQPGPYVMFAVTDNGKGMSREVQEKIFEPFFSTKGSKGTGLGLSIVYGIIKQHGGNIFVYSEADVGTTFKIYLPSTDKTEDELVLKEQEHVLHGTQTVLVVDDEASIRRLIIDALQPLGYRLIEASCGKEALEKIKNIEGEIDIMLTDVIMPEMSGRELADAIRESRPSIKVIFMSGYTDNSIVHHGILDTHVNFLPKPITHNSLMKKLKSVLTAC